MTSRKSLTGTNKLINLCVTHRKISVAFSLRRVRFIALQSCSNFKMILGLAITALAFVVILISWIYKTFIEVRFYFLKIGFSEAQSRRCAILARCARAVSPGLTLRFHPCLTANELLTYVKYRLFFKVSFNMLCVNHVYQYLIRLPILIKKFVVTNILKTSGIQFAFPPVNRCQCTLKKKSSPGIRKKNWKACSGAIN